MVNIQEGKKLLMQGFLIQNGFMGFGGRFSNIWWRLVLWHSAKLLIDMVPSKYRADIFYTVPKG